MKKPKIALIGAGSLVFCKTLVSDILATPALQGSRLCLMSPTRSKLEKMTSFVEKMIKVNTLPATVEMTLDRRKALADADYVICMIQIGGVEAFEHDYTIPMKYGVDQCIGDSMGPGGIMRSLRTIPVLVDLIRDMEELCPRALLLNYTNPMAACCFALGRVSQTISSVGLCHGVQTTLDLISRYVETPKEEIAFSCAGINHMAWFLSLAHRETGEDLYPLFRRNCEKPGYYINEKVRIETMRHFGYFMTESTGHLSEYLPWFRSSPRALKEYCDEPGFGGETGAYYHYCRMLAEKFERVNYLETESPRIQGRSNEYCSYILEACETANPFLFQGNVRNDGYITNLPAGCCVEVPVYADGQGIHPLVVGDLPLPCAALNQSNITVQAMAVEAGLTGDPELVMNAIALDPLTGACCTLREVREMTAELLAAESHWLPQFNGKSLRAAPSISVPAGVKRIEVPVDPALAIANRFGELAQRSV